MFSVIDIILSEASKKDSSKDNDDIKLVHDDEMDEFDKASDDFDKNFDDDNSGDSSDDDLPDDSSDDGSDDTNDSDADSDIDGDSSEDDNTEGDDLENNATTEDPVAAMKNKKLATDFLTLHNNISVILDQVTKIDRLDDAESEILKFMQSEIDRTRTILYDYISDLYSKKSYEENLYMYYNFETSIKVYTEIIEKISELRNDE